MLIRVIRVIRGPVVFCVIRGLNHFFNYLLFRYIE